MGPHLKARHAPVLVAGLAHAWLVGLLVTTTAAPTLPASHMPTPSEWPPALRLRVSEALAAPAEAPHPPASTRSPVPAQTHTLQPAAPSLLPGLSTDPETTTTAAMPSIDPGAQAAAALPAAQEAPANASPPTPLHQPAPSYPTLSRRLGEQGTVVLRLRTNPEGRVISAQVHRSSGFARLDESATQAALRWRFASASAQAPQVVSGVLLPIRFVLDTPH